MNAGYHFGHTCHRFTSSALGDRAPCTCWIAGWVDTRCTPDAVQKRSSLPLPRMKPQFYGL